MLDDEQPEWMSREWPEYPGPDLESCGWSGGRGCTRQIVAHTPSRNMKKGLINVCREHALKAKDQVDRGTRPWLKWWTLRPEENTDAVIAYLVEVARG